MQRAKFIRIFENIDKIWRFEPFVCSPSVRGRTRGRGPCARKSGRNGPLSISSDLCKNFSPRGLAWHAPDCRIRLESTESPRGDSRETGSADGGKGRKSGDEDHRMEKFCSGSFSRRSFIFDLQRPSLALSRSFTAFGLALPPDAFIT